MIETKTSCNKCGSVIQGTEKLPKNLRKGRLKSKDIPLYPWTVHVTHKYWQGYSFELCDKCRKELLDSLVLKAEDYDC